MAKARTLHRCTACGETAPQWVGRCASCGGWGTVVEERVPVRVVAGAAAPRPASAPRPIAEVDGGGHAPVPTGLVEVDRVLGGGLVRGSVTLLGGEPGVGKSTLLLQLAATAAAAGRRCLYVSAEESATQVRGRAERLGALPPELWLASETVLPDLLGGLDAVDPELLVVDSIQTVLDPELGSAPGTVLQVRECAARLVAEAKQRGVAVLLVGHVTKDGALAGPRVLEHLVDTVLSFEGDRHHALRLLRALKHRYGPTGELGLLEMGDDGLRPVPDASGLFLTDRRPGLPGSVVVPTIEGQRPLLVEVQALTSPSPLPQPRRSAQGVDGGRLALLLAVLGRWASCPTVAQDVFVSAVGGVRVAEPAADLGIALSVVSALTGRPVPPDVVVIGEVGLGGELRQVAQAPRRLAEAARLGFTHALVPASSPAGPEGCRLLRAATLAEAVSLAGLAAAPTVAPGARAPGRERSLT